MPRSKKEEILKVLGYVVLNGGKKRYKYRSIVTGQGDIERIRDEMYIRHADEKIESDKHEAEQIALGNTKTFPFEILIIIRQPMPKKLHA